MKILKFGGTALSSRTGFSSLCSRISEIDRLGETTTLVVSALEGITDLLVRLTEIAPQGDPAYDRIVDEIRQLHGRFIEHHLQENEAESARTFVDSQLGLLGNVLLGLSLVHDISARTADVILSFGELLSAALVTAALRQQGFRAETVDARTMIITDDSFGNARVKMQPTIARIRESCPDDGKVRVVTGFIAATSRGETTTLGRGGSDYTASLIGLAVGAPELELWTTVDGVMTADPKRVSGAFPLPELTYDEALELCHFGAKIINPLAMQPAIETGMTIRIRNALRPEAPGTVISSSPVGAARPITGFSSIPAIALFQLCGSGLIGVSGTARRLFDALSRRSINVILISQASSETSICFAIDPRDRPLARLAVEDEFALERANHQVELDDLGPDYAIVACVGSHMRQTRGIAGRLFQALGKNGINVVAIAQGSSELNISVVVARNDEAKALNALHDAFFLSDVKTVHLFLAGTGLVGQALLRQILAQRENLRSRHLRFVLNGIANSTRMAISPSGLDPAEWKDALSSHAEPSSPAALLHEMRRLNLPNSIFIDCTASDDVAAIYPEALASSISVVTPNKRANAGSYSQWMALRESAARGNVKFFYETNVGAGLPVIGTLSDLLSSGDEIVRIEAILSGTLSFIFNTVRRGTSFSEIVKEAKRRGYTEPDPRDDLCGKDVARKLLILAREIGLALEEHDITVESLVPVSCRSATTLDEFFAALEHEDAAFEKLRASAEERGEVLRYVGAVEKGRAHVALSTLPASHPFASLSGSDNVISFTTRRYNDRPLVVQGPGAGTEVTAAGVLADIMRAASYL